MSKKSVWFGALAFVVIVGSCNAANDEPATTSAASTATAPTRQGDTIPANAAPAAPADSAGPAGEVVTVSKVIDGDTFEVSDGRRIRVLGIDSCEIETWPGESAKHEANYQLMINRDRVELLTEPGVDTDRYGRHLRYVHVDGQDLGIEMVKHDHTGVYQGKNDASEAYLQTLYAHDLDRASNPPAGMDCSDPAATSGGSIDFGDGEDDGMRDGALTGGFCARKKWC